MSQFITRTWFPLTSHTIATIAIASDQCSCQCFPNHAFIIRQRWGLTLPLPPQYHYCFFFFFFLPLILRSPTPCP
ncbi:hypothetical protein EX30DRAFT_53175 [Ascodesmis nigricans]|uniref:Uncharacterized protein n=1 Tax=Ascodesmis nigricans TaxID=341454 RepID=A0A4S2MV93_9PEZI|nr:hypothetical protein EX30DRAFT_53175 [Ascodesmis nigricans]